MSASTPTRAASAPDLLGGRVAQAEMRAANMGLILRHLRAHGGLSRARLARLSGLSKATISSLVADLADRGLVREEGTVHDGAVGRPALTIAIDGERVAGVGVELNVHQVAVTAVTLSGVVIRESVTAVDVAHLGMEVVLDRVSARLDRTLASLRESGVEVVGVVVSPPGIIDYAAGALRFAPNFGWRSIPLRDEIARRLGPDAPPLRLENDAKLAALAEYALRAPDGVRDLVYLTGEVGVGAGIIADGRLLRGYSGFSGEVGHLALNPEPVRCNCGRLGCWETAVGLVPFLRDAIAPDDPLGAPGRLVEGQLLALAERARAGDPRVLAALATVTQHLDRGLSLLIDVLNPSLIVLGGYFAHFGDQLIPALSELLAGRQMDDGTGVRIVTSEFGPTASARGGALLALEDVFDNPGLVPVRS